MYRKEFYLVVLTALFSFGQLWAFMVVLRTVHVGGPALLAMGVTLAGSSLAIGFAWRHVLRRSRAHVTELWRG